MLILRYVIEHISFLHIKSKSAGFLFHSLYYLFTISAKSVYYELLIYDESIMVQFLQLCPALGMLVICKRVVSKGQLLLRKSLHTYKYFLYAFQDNLFYILKINIL